VSYCLKLNPGKTRSLRGHPGKIANNKGEYHEYQSVLASILLQFTRCPSRADGSDRGYIPGMSAMSVFAPVTHLFAARTRRVLPWCLLLCLESLGVVACATVATVDPLLSEAIRWYTGEAGHIDDPRARQLLEQAARDRDPVSVMWLARVYSTGRMTYPADKSRAVMLADAVLPEIEVLAHAGNAEAAFLLGTAWAEGLGKPEDPEMALQWYRQAAAQGHILAQHNIGNGYFSGTGVEQSDADAVHWWQLAANAGDTVPMYRLGTMYELGRGVAADMEKAMAWYQAAAERRYPAAIEALARLSGEL